MADVIWDGTDLDNDHTKLGNFVAGAVPGGGDNEIIPAMPHADTTDIDGVVAAAALVNFTIEEGCSVDIGKHDVVGTYLDVDADHSFLDGDGTVLLKVSNGTDITVTGAGRDSGPGTWGMYLKGDLTDLLAIDLAAGESLGLAPLTAEVASFPKIHISGLGDVTIGKGVTCATELIMNGSGDVTCYATIGTISNDGPDFLYAGDGMATSLTVISGTVDYRATGTNAVVSLHIYGLGTVDFHKLLYPITITDLIMNKGAHLDMRGGQVTITNAIQTPGCSPGEVTILADPNQALNFAGDV